jgi:hypothetical protein
MNMSKAKNTSSKASKARRARPTDKQATAARLKAIAEGARLKRVGDKEFDLSDYVAVKSAGGNSSLDCGDDLAEKLRGMELDEVYALASKKLEMPEKVLRQRYAKLNVGMQRMNLGNRMRAGSKAKAAKPARKTTATRARKGASVQAAA